MTDNRRLNNFLLASPFLVLIFTKFVILFSTNYFRPEVSWIPAFIGYYFAIISVFFISTKYLSLPVGEIFSFSLKPFPKFGLLFGTIIIPAMLPLAAFILNVKNVPWIFLLYIVIFSCINPIFEEAFWRGLLNYLPGKNAFRILYTAVLFSFSHYFLWEYWFKFPLVIIPTLISTFIMGVLWMYFMQKQKNLAYPIISHFFVDIFNLSVAVYCGIVTFGN